MTTVCHGRGVAFREIMTPIVLWGSMFSRLIASRLKTLLRCGPISYGDGYVGAGILGRTSAVSL